MWSTPIDIDNNYLEPRERYRHFLKKYYKMHLDHFQYEIWDWKTTSTSGYWMRPHNHGHSCFTSIYYKFYSGEGGELILNDPRTNANRGWPMEFTDEFKPVIIQPETGMTVTFPSYIYHTAAPFNGIARKAYVSEIQLMSDTLGKPELGVTSV